MYSKIVGDHFSDPRNVGQLDAPDLVGIAGKVGQGNFMVLHIDLDGDTISDCRFQTFGCAPAIAAGSLLTQMIKGQRVEDVLVLTPRKLEEALGGLPLGRKHCAAIAAQALKAAFEPGDADADE